MNHLVIAVLLMVFVIYSYCQKVIKVEKKFDHSKQISESYYVLKSDNKTKHGEYISYFRYSDIDESLIQNGIKNKEDFIKEKGTYVYGKKDGVWIEFINQSEMDSGRYSNGKKVGVWNTYLGSQKIRSYDYDNNKKVGVWLTLKEKGMVIERYDYDNNTQLEPIIRLKMSYPELARENEIQGTVKVQYHIKPDCSIDNISITQSLSTECDHAVMNAMKKYAEMHKKYNKNCVDKIEEREIQFKLR